MLTKCKKNAVVTPAKAIFFTFPKLPILQKIYCFLKQNLNMELMQLLKSIDPSLVDKFKGCQVLNATPK